MSCGAAAQDTTKECETCGREFAFQTTEAGTSSLTQVLEAPLGARPDGSTMIPIGAALMVFGILGVFGSLMIDPVDYAGIDHDKIALQWNLLIGGGALAQIGFFLLLVGYILRAISFLPGRES
jgi:hypothetical protein